MPREFCVSFLGSVNFLRVIIYAISIYFFVRNVVTIVDEYLSYPYTVKINFQDDEEFEVPAVTICVLPKFDYYNSKAEYEINSCKHINYSVSRKKIYKIYSKCNY